jgi:hypothetical protein
MLLSDLVRRLDPEYRLEADLPQNSELRTLRFFISAIRRYPLVRTIA